MRRLREKTTYCLPAELVHDTVCIGSYSSSSLLYNFDISHNSVIECSYYFSSPLATPPVSRNVRGLQ